MNRDLPPDRSSPDSIPLGSLRRDYALRGLSEGDLDPNPFRQFGRWFQEALDAKVSEPNAMTLSTVSAEGRPRGRIVLLKGFDEKGFVFYTNYRSEKGRHLEANPHAALTFSWLDLERQVCVEGAAEKTSREESESYFQSRPPGSQFGALASDQSAVIPDRQVLVARLAELQERYPKGGAPLPEHWGGYRIVPESVEFWQGRPNRLHDRLRYRREAGGWKVERLAP